MARNGYNRFKQKRGCQIFSCFVPALKSDKTCYTGSIQRKNRLKRGLEKKTPVVKPVSCEVKKRSRKKHHSKHNQPPPKSENADAPAGGDKGKDELFHDNLVISSWFPRSPARVAGGKDRRACLLPVVYQKPAAPATRNPAILLRFPPQGELELDCGAKSNKRRGRNIERIMACRGKGRAAHGGESKRGPIVPLRQGRHR